MAISLSKAVNPVRINSRSTTRSKVNGSQYKLISDGNIPTVEYSFEESGVVYYYNVATLDGLKLKVNDNNLRLLKTKHDISVTETKIQKFVNSLVNKETLASLAQDGLLSLESAIPHYFEAIVTTAEIDLDDSSLEDCVLQLMLQSSRQAVFAGSNSAMDKMLSKLTAEDEQRLRDKVSAYIASNPHLLKGKEVKQLESDRTDRATETKDRFQVMSKKQLQALLTECEIEFKAKATKEQLLALLHIPYAMPTETSETLETENKVLVTA